MGLLPEFDAQEILSLHCPLCPFHSHWTAKLESHFAESHLGRSAEIHLYQCSICKKISSSKTFILEHLELQHKLPKERVEKTPTSPSSDSDAMMSSENCGETVPRPGSTPETSLSNIPTGCAIPIFSGSLRGGETCDGSFLFQCIFCEFSTSDKEALSCHYAHHGIKNLQRTERLLAAVSEASTQMGSSKSNVNESMQIVS